MYLKSIEIHGFKSFANKIVLDFHNGITGIVGPNGSGKSNVGDAVRWVLGEQSAKQLRGASMQDIIFAGTQNRKPLSYAYVAITMDNSDHTLPVDYEEVTVARRVYRSGESEYLLNGTSCRLRDVNELFYDTGIGKEGYSIIGQGQVERILSGKPEERRELFDEAVGIVKFKKRKAATLKKLEEERDNLTRVNDILSELERQVGPLERQASTAKLYLKKREELKNLDVNMFLLEVERLNKQIDSLNENFENASKELADHRARAAQMKEEYAQTEAALEKMDQEMEEVRRQQSEGTVNASKLENQISLLEEQIRSAEMSDENLAARKKAIETDQENHEAERQKQLNAKKELVKVLEEAEVKLAAAKEKYLSLQEKVSASNDKIEADKNELLSLMEKKADLKSQEQAFKTMLEQININKARLTQRILQRQTEEGDLTAKLDDANHDYEMAKTDFDALSSKAEQLKEKADSWRSKRKEATEHLQTATGEYHKKNSRLESLKNIAERYDGYGNSIRRIMEQKDHNPGILGVVSDLIHVEQKYEVAIETALGGNIQNIVTEDEATAKKMISYLKEHRAGRATFLPLTSVDGKNGIKNPDVLDEDGILGAANELVEADTKYDGVVRYLLGRVVVAENIDVAIRTAKKYHYSMHIVTLEGEYLSPGGSMSGGRFKNNSNLLSRNREIDQLASEVESLRQQMKEDRERIEEVSTAMALLEDDRKENQEALQKAALTRNTAKMNLEQIQLSAKNAQAAYESLVNESREIEKQITEVKEGQEKLAEDAKVHEAREAELNKEIEGLQASLGGVSETETQAREAVNQVQMEEAAAKQKVTFIQENLDRIGAEIEKDQNNIKQLVEQTQIAKEDAARKKGEIEKIRQTMLAADKQQNHLSKDLKRRQKERDELNQKYKGSFERREEVSNRINALDKEIYRLDQQRQKASEALDYQNNYMWENYEITLHQAMDMANEEVEDPRNLRRQISDIKDEIRKMGNVNVNAIEEYQEISGRYTFLKTQHDDLIKAEASLVQIVNDLDEGMRKQFTEGFAEIQKQFDITFMELFGGGHGALELVEGEDILETGIRIIAQPPGKKLQNMMQMSGGEKSLTAIALLFAIQNLKPSPFCFLDEIEAALDDSNVDRYAKYLHKLTKNTQFIVITHRRGTMNAADRLYGITMQEKGISTLVSVNLIENELED